MREVDQSRLRLMLASMAEKIEPTDEWDRIRGDLSRQSGGNLEVDDRPDVPYVLHANRRHKRRRRTVSILVAAAVVVAVVAGSVAASRSDDDESRPAVLDLGEGMLPYYVPGWLPDGLLLHDAFNGPPSIDDVDGWAVIIDRDDGSLRVSINSQNSQNSQNSLGGGSLTDGTSDSGVVQQVGICDGLETIPVRGTSGCIRRSAADLTILTVDDGDRLLTLGTVGKASDEALTALANDIEWSTPTGLEFSLRAAGFTEQFAGPLALMRPADMWLAHYQASNTSQSDAAKPWLSTTNLTISATRRPALAPIRDVSLTGEPIDVNGIAARLIVLLPQQSGAPENYSIVWEMPGGVSVSVSGQNLSRDDVVRAASSLRKVSSDEWIQATGSAPNNQQNAAATTEPGPTETTARAVINTALVLSDSGASQTPQDATRDHVVPAVAALPMSKRVAPIGSPMALMTPWATEGASAQGIWVLSRLADGADPEGGSGVLGDSSGAYGADFIAPAEYGELLLIDPTGSKIVKAYPFPGQPPSQLLLTPDAVYCAHVGDGGLPSSMLCRVDLTTHDATVRVFHCDLPDCGKSEDELQLPGWTIDGPATIHAQLAIVGDTLVSSDENGTSTFDATTLKPIPTTTR